MSVLWQDPPPRKHIPTHEILEVIPKLRSRPNEWALVWTGGGSGCDSRRRLLTQRGVQTRTARGATPGLRELYARWPSPESFLPGR